MSNKDGGTTLLSTGPETWQTMDTAPRDGTEVLGWHAECGVVLMRWAAPVDFMTEAEVANEECPHEAGWFGADFVSGYRLSGPTYWMPLPPSPEQEGEYGGLVKRLRKQVAKLEARVEELDSELWAING